MIVLLKLNVLPALGFLRSGERLIILDLRHLWPKMLLESKLGVNHINILDGRITSWAAIGLFTSRVLGLGKKIVPCHDKCSLITSHYLFHSVQLKKFMSCTQWSYLKEMFIDYHPQLEIMSSLIYSTSYRSHFII